MNSDEIKAKALEIGFHKVGITAPSGVEETRAINRLQRWLGQGLQADMGWMASSKRQDIYQVMPEVESVICVALNYYTPEQHSPAPDVAKISRYGWGKDYHKVLHKKLKQLASWIEQQSPGIVIRYYADTGPIQDKVWAEKAGLGWISKNSNLITREYGSWVFLGEILTSLKLESDSPHSPHCGSCTRCLEACPTGAIVEPFVVDAGRCIAYHTIENRSAQIPDQIANKMQGWVAGCDICQDVCPWNIRFAQPTNVSEFAPYPHNISPSLTELASLSEEEWNSRFPASALRRIKPAMWRRNAQANLNYSQLSPENLE